LIASIAHTYQASIKLPTHTAHQLTEDKVSSQLVYWLFFDIDDHV
jgi:hypothetical protein